MDGLSTDLEKWQSSKVLSSTEESPKNFGIVLKCFLK